MFCDIFDKITSIKSDNVKVDEVKVNDDVKSESEEKKVFTDCYEELADLLNTDKKAAGLLAKIKKDGNMFKLMQIVNGTSVPSEKAEVTNDKVTENKEEVHKSEVHNEDKSEVTNEAPEVVNPLAGLANMFSGGQGGQGLNDMMAGLMKNAGQQNNPAIDNMMKSFGPVMENLMGKDFANNLQSMSANINPTTQTTTTTTTSTTTSTTKEKKTNKPKTTKEILQELEKNDEVD